MDLKCKYLQISLSDCSYKRVVMLALVKEPVYISRNDKTSRAPAVELRNLERAFLVRVRTADWNDACTTVLTWPLRAGDATTQAASDRTQARRMCDVLRA